MGNAKRKRLRSNSIGNKNSIICSSLGTMNNDPIKDKLERIKNDDKFDTEFSNILLSSYLKKEKGEAIAKQIIEEIEKRYVENKKN